MKKKLYLAGKITGDKNYREKFKEYEEILDSGFIILNPANSPSGMGKADYMRICFAMIDTADIAAFLPDWQYSKGAKLERAYCEYIGKEIVEVQVLK